jgi:hypothetical protein
MKYFILLFIFSFGLLYTYEVIREPLYIQTLKNLDIVADSCTVKGVLVTPKKWCEVLSTNSCSSYSGQYYPWICDGYIYNFADNCSTYLYDTLKAESSSTESFHQVECGTKYWEYTCALTYTPNGYVCYNTLARQRPCGKYYSIGPC